MIFVPYGWENRGTWAGINYFPAQPSNEAWKTVNAELAKTGTEKMHLFVPLCAAVQILQDRLGTNIGKTQERDALFLQVMAPCSLSLGPGG
jgi:hypothetical protein